MQKEESSNSQRLFEISQLEEQKRKKNENPRKSQLIFEKGAKEYKIGKE